MQLHHGAVTEFSPIVEWKRKELDKEIGKVEQIHEDGNPKQPKAEPFLLLCTMKCTSHLKVNRKVKSLSGVRLFATPWTECSRPEHWSG